MEGAGPREAEEEVPGGLLRGGAEGVARQVGEAGVEGVTM